VAGSLSFAPGISSASISVPILNDNLNEADETFTLSLASPTNGLLSASTVTTTISDTLTAAITTSLPASVENLLLTGSAAIDGNGNAFANRLRGNGANNSLNGGAGADTLDGGAGSDTLTGGGDPDTVVLRFGQSTAGATDRITDFAIGSDKLSLLSSNGVNTVPTGLSQAANWLTSNPIINERTLESLVLSAFTDANGSLPGKQPLGPNAAAVLVVTAAGSRNTFLMANDTVAGYQKANDLVVNITGYTGNLSTSLQPATWFV
jgi:hypothetical protein